MNENCRIVCPICSMDVRLTKFYEHVKENKNNNKGHVFFIKMLTDDLIKMLERCSYLKNNKNNVYFNWDYYFKINYKLDNEDEKIYNNIKNRNKEIFKNENYIRKMLIDANPDKYSVDIINDCVVYKFIEMNYYEK